MCAEPVFHSWIRPRGRTRPRWLALLAIRHPVPHTEEVISLSLDTWISLAVLVTSLSGFYVALRREIGYLRQEMKSEIARLEGHIVRLDDRVYALAAASTSVPPNQQTR